MERLEQIIGYTFRNKKLLKQALTHSSYATKRSLANWAATNVWSFSGTPFWSLSAATCYMQNSPKFPRGS